MAEDVWDIMWKWGDYPNANEFEVAENWWEALKAGISFLSQLILSFASQQSSLLPL
ncbi:hypothetical protein PUR_36100 [Paenibacillus sp. URB8-2]|nr:hypothetical protein PUR_36100 [Paenibacillus sp. URB8-2]